MSEARCEVCARNPNLANSMFRECSHVDCPHRRPAWGDIQGRMLGSPRYERNVSEDPKPLDGELR